MSWISFDAIKKAVSLEMVLQHYGIELRQVNPTTRRGKCPLPTHGSDKNKTSFTATLSKGVGGAWACQSRSCMAARNGKRGGNALDFVAAMENCSIRGAAEKIQSTFGITSASGDTERSNGKRNEDTKTQLVSKGIEEKSVEVNKPLGFELQGIDPTHPYLKSRGVSEEIAREFGIGYFSGRGSMAKRIVFPIHNERGELVAFAGKAIDDSEPRYKFPAGFHKSLELYNLHRSISEANSRKRVIVVEGFFDCLKVISAGYFCVAIMGSAMSKEQEELLVLHFKAACILLDGDEAGQAGASDCVTRLSRRMWVWAPVLPEGKQPDMLTAEELQALIGK